MVTLTPGTRLGPYEITAALGAGGQPEGYFQSSPFGGLRVVPP